MNKEEKDKLIAERDEFIKLITIEESTEATHITGLIKLYTQKKRDYKFVILPTYNTLLELCNEFIVKVQPIVRYVIIRLQEQGKKEYCKRWKDLLHSIDTQNLNQYYTKLNGSGYAKSIYYKKLHNALEKDQQKIHAIILLVYALCPFKDKPIKQQTMGVPSQEFDEMFEE